MNRPTLSMIVSVLAALVSPGIASAQGSARDESRPAGEWNFTLDERLAALDPSDPQGYFLFGEEVAAEPMSDEKIALAQRLYVLAIVFASGDPSLRSVAGGACVALSDITRSEADRRALRSIASSLDPRFGTRDWSRSAEAVVTDDLAYEAAVTLGMIRAGFGTSVRSELKRPELRRLIDRFSALITGTPNQNILPELESQAERWPCPECHNERLVTKRHTGQVERRLCYTCGGNPGPSLTREQLIGQLRFEAQVLGSSPRSWGAQVAADLGAPLREADIADLPLRFGVDITRPWFRAGEWVAQPDEPSAGAGEAPGGPGDENPRP